MSGRHFVPRHSGVLLALCLATVSLSAQITSERLANAASEPQQWMMYSGAYDGSRFSPLDQINRTNVQRLSLQWVFQTGVRGRHETTPLVIDGIMYLTTPQNHAYAVDTRTGRPLWHYQRTLPKEKSSADTIADRCTAFPTRQKICFP